ncbi:CAAX amino terminal protease self- immunity [Chryseobacterium nakagawai]|uniref:CPBP family intramembrane metalloprotease n=1 Tax=Chryseobacterium nakagawai TaxID=1241982 RepID=A0AAD0YGQ5_CHRNA|nr:type II CAAX endopeptidase family protein [Chryseobacterium nakagawai]AZA89722.1 CPBP family intramembrane metalloprotease [Chryseobacterium nakagawai]VEH21107.1 CAAX amino terminal protease self- immunity [Chryseobacterium nakagawai]
MGNNGKYSVGILLTFVLLGTTMLYVFPVISMITGVKAVSGNTFSLSRIAIWTVLLIIFLYSLLIEKGSFLLIKEKKYSIIFNIKAIVFLYLICVFGGAILNGLIQFLIHKEESNKILQFTSLFKNDYFLIIFTCLTAGIVEELLMRGYIQPRIEKIYNSPLLGILVSAALFGILHSTYGTIGQVVVPFFIGAVFAMFYKKYSNIKILIVCHFMIDFITLMVMNFIDFKHLSVF